MASSKCVGGFFAWIFGVLDRARVLPAKAELGSGRRRESVKENRIFLSSGWRKEGET